MIPTGHKRMQSNMSGQVGQTNNGGLLLEFEDRSARSCASPDRQKATVFAITVLHICHSCRLFFFKLFLLSFQPQTFYLSVCVFFAHFSIQPCVSNTFIRCHFTYIFKSLSLKCGTSIEKSEKNNGIV